MKKTELVNKETGEVVKRPYKTQYVAQQIPFAEKDLEKNKEVSMTVPGQTMTVLEMIRRHRKGLPIDESKGALYQGEELLPDIDKMDLIDRQAYMDSVADALVEVKARIQSSVKTKKEQEILDRIDVAVREKIASMNRRNDVTDVEDLSNGSK